MMEDLYFVHTEDQSRLLEMKEALQMPSSVEKYVMLRRAHYRALNDRLQEINRTPMSLDRRLELLEDLERELNLL